ncbi:hypothetical protein PF005_g17237 [Phytophthora fragariae]|uniref:FYVE-type domain-containing protein n=1 Tax=Phytophthora fragariae TaxID=53985 RepID=A0A6A3T1V9_9STRA|nr:hypothetical protein PF003_g12752 [Phytophthora fragariae]KAE8931387.1 hypothetical protein PF009_g18548 [Phytophthora fragariae]KAE9095353.1 hypothetical protein PF010_g16735 [Phytophthora fragariae]KAE9095425.1 hypothetical protein PF007_g17384 [Phytophthora fragariae]KAE9127853.1 hypothetical protein PF006_g16422 [Phytophthora fragariae]
MSDQEICDDIVATVPKLSTAVARDTYGRRWKQGHRRHGVDLFELAAASGGDAADEDRDITYAVVAKAELRCHLNEVLNVLVTDESNVYESTMKALAGKKFKRGDVLFSQRRLLSPELRRQSMVASQFDMEEGATQSPEQAVIGVNVATLRPRMPVDLNKKTQKLCFSTFTQQYPGQDRAVHVMKTLPKELHDQLIPRTDRTALRGQVDHLCVGFHIQSTHSDQDFAGSSSHVTRIFAHGYASPTPPTQFGESTKSSDDRMHLTTPTELARRRESIMNPEAKHVLNVLTKSLRQFERVVRRRRFGFQTFVYFPTGYDDPSVEKSCSICSKRFRFFRRDFFCHLCGHMVCGECSQLYEGEARVGDLRRNRCCLQCVHRVDSCVFDDEDLLQALGPAVVAVDDALWCNDDKYHLEATNADADTASVTSDSSSVEEQQYSDDPSQNSHALNLLGQLVNPVAANHEYQFVGPKPHSKNKRHRNAGKAQKVTQDVESYLSQGLRVMKDRYSDLGQCVVADLEERDYVFEFDAKKTKAQDHPMPPMPAPKKEARRLEAIEQMGMLQPEYDHAALDLVAQVAAKRLNCPIGFVSVVDKDSFHAVGTYNLPEEAFTLPRTNNVCIHAVYAEKPLILKNPMRDMRFSQMPCVKDLGVKFYAGFPVHGPNGEVVASLCAADAVPHHNISTKDYATMEALAKLASELVAPKTPVVR